ncbi:MAG: hypothetical protein LLG97_06970 [Deltaproteobacteria bacterium]|nr:hypothetical protein [Deltaproteobacteria bacterium]
MSEALKIVVMILVVIAAFALTLVIASWKTRRACKFIIRDLREKKAFDPASAVELSYAKSSLFHIGMRDYRPKALGALVKFDQIRVTAENRYYLRQVSEEQTNP